MKSIYVNKDFMPRIQHTMLADSLLNALIAFSGDFTWNEGVNLLYYYAVRLAVRPYDVSVVNAILADLGLAKIRKPATYGALKELLADENVAFGRIGARMNSARMAVFVSDGEDLLAFSDTDPFTHKVNAVWMAGKELVRSRIRELRDKAGEEQDVETSLLDDGQTHWEDTKYFHYFQPNPQSRNIGDCVIRAFCAVTGESWGAVMKQLAESLGSRNLDFNYNNNFLNLLLDKGFGRCHPVPKKGGRLMTGEEVCEWLKQRYPKGNCKAFAFVGRSHVAGVLPYQEDAGEICYRYHDSWDSTWRRVTEIYTKVEESEQPKEVPKQRLTSVELDMYLEHPQYGVGQVRSITPYQQDAFVTVQFDTGLKSILKSWALQHCWLPPETSS